MSELEAMVLGTILANQILIMNHLNKDSEEFKIGQETSDMMLDALQKLLNKES